MRQPEAVAGLDLAARHLESLRELLAEHLPGVTVWAYGSRVNGGGHEGSDLDLVVRHADDPARPVVGVDRLREALEASALPMKVDVLDWAQLPVAFRTEIERGCLRIAPA